jgi:hypothetical protein
MFTASFISWCYLHPICSGMLEAEDCALLSYPLQ